MKMMNYHETNCVSYHMWLEQHENTIVNGKRRHGETVLTSPTNLKIPKRDSGRYDKGRKLGDRDRISLRLEKKPEGKRESEWQFAR